MSYEPTNWKSGDVVTSAKLNKLEQGVANAGGGSGVLVVQSIYDESTDKSVLDKTWKEIYDAAQNSLVLLAYQNDSENGLIFGGYLETIDSIRGFSLSVVSPYFESGTMTYSRLVYTATDQDSYPVFDNDE